MSSHVTVLGSCGAWLEPGRACSGFLVEHGGSRVVLGLGHGTMPRLLDELKSGSGDGSDAVVISHAHPDHLVDLHGLFRARWFTRRGCPRLPLFASDGVWAILIELEGGDPTGLLDVFDVRLSAPDLTIAYTGDTGPAAAPADLGRDADLFIVDATDRYQQPGVPFADGPELDLTAEQAGAAATTAGAQRLMLTHFWPGNDRQASADAAARVYPGKILLAEEGMRVRLL